MFNLSLGSELLRLLSEPTRLRLLLLLESQALTVAELTAITQLSQSRISTHLGKLKQADLVEDERMGQATLYSTDTNRFSPAARQLWGALVDNLDDQQIREDMELAQATVRQRNTQRSWVESVAGRMEQQYSPGRSWEATARALINLLELGQVLDIASGDGVLAELIANRAESVTCLDSNATVISAARKRLKSQLNVQFHQGDMHQLPFEDNSFDQIFLMHALTYTQEPQSVISQAARVLRPQGSLILTTLRQHQHEATVSAFDHVNLGFALADLEGWIEAAGLTVESAGVSSREQRPPHFEVLTLVANKTL